MGKDMSKPNFDILRKVLKPVSSERLAEILRMRVSPESGGEQLTIADAGLEDEVSGILERRAAAEGSRRQTQQMENFKAEKDSSTD
jgi:hypothetical protein